MNGLLILIGRDLKLAFRGGTDAAMAVVFFILAATLFPFGVGPDLDVLPRIGGGVIWVVALLAAMLSLERMFSTDYEDGSLEQFALSPLPMGMVALAKIIAHWADHRRLAADRRARARHILQSAEFRHRAAYRLDADRHTDLESDRRHRRRIDPRGAT